MVKFLSKYLVVVVVMFAASAGHAFIGQDTPDNPWRTYNTLEGNCPMGTAPRPAAQRASSSTTTAAPVCEVSSVPMAEHGDEFRSNPIVICRNKGCTQLSDRMSRNFLFSTLSSLLYANDNTKVFLCEADPVTRACLGNGIRYAVDAGGTAGVIFVPSLTLTNVAFSQNMRRLSFMFLYDNYVNGMKSYCTGAHNIIDISSNRQAVIRDNGYKCQITSDRPSQTSTVFHIDYIDLDYSIMGAYYMTNTNTTVSGGGMGYILFKFQNPAAMVALPDMCTDPDRCGGQSSAIAPGQYEVRSFKE